MRIISQEEMNLALAEIGRNPAIKREEISSLVMTYSTEPLLLTQFKSMPRDAINRILAKVSALLGDKGYKAISFINYIYESE